MLILEKIPAKQPVLQLAHAEVENVIEVIKI